MHRLFKCGYDIFGFSNLQRTKSQLYVYKMICYNSDGKKYWSASVVPPNTVNRPWYDTYYQSPPLDIEIASYALLYYVHTHQLTEGAPVLRWLTTQRNSMGGFRSTQVNINESLFSLFFR